MGDLITSFLYALLKQWIVLMSGIVSVTITLIQRARGKEPKDNVFWSIAAFCILIAFFFAWADEHAKLNQAQKELTAVRDKRFTCKIEKVTIGEEPDTKLAQVFVNLTLRNTGAPSIAEKYKLHIKASDLEYNGEPTDISKEYTMITEGKTKNVTFLPQNSLITKTAQPIANGDKKDGWLRFVMPKDVTPDFIGRPGIKYTISLVDVNEKPCSADYVLPKNTQ